MRKAGATLLALLGSAGAAHPSDPDVTFRMWVAPEGSRSRSESPFSPAAGPAGLDGRGRGEAVLRARLRGFAAELAARATAKRGEALLTDGIVNELFYEADALGQPCRGARPCTDPGGRREPAVRRPTALIADDEPQLLAFMRSALAARWPELEIVGEALDGQAAIEIVEARRPDVAFLDIQMPGAGGLEVARRAAGRCHVVFVTAYEQYAVQAFDRAAVDYLLKPVDGDRLAETIARLKARLTAPPPDMAGLLEHLAERLRPAASHLQWLKVQSRKDVLLVAWRRWTSSSHPTSTRSPSRATRSG